MSIAGSRHAMGGAQFGSGVGAPGRAAAQAGVLALDGHRGSRSRSRRASSGRRLIGGACSLALDTFAQKQTGADRLSIGGAVSANVHGRGLTMRPFVADVESLSRRRRRRASSAVPRTEDPDLFRLVLGGYGLFGVVFSVTLRLVPRRTLERVVEVKQPTGSWTRSTSGSRRASSTATSSSRSIRPRPTSSTRHLLVLPARPRPASARRATRALRDDWRRLLQLAHTDKSPRVRPLHAALSGHDRAALPLGPHQLAFYASGYHETSVTAAR